MAEQVLKPEFFVVRDNGDIVLLLAVDELPYHINLAGVSRVMTPFDITGMTCIGNKELRHRQYAVKSAPELAANNNKIADREALKAKFFITRNSGNMVPAVAMDEMPEQFVVEGVPRLASAHDITGMTCIGTFGRRRQVHTVEDSNNPPLSYFAEKAGVGHDSSKSNSVFNTPVPVNSPYTIPDLSKYQSPFSPSLESVASKTSFATVPTPDDEPLTLNSPAPLVETPNQAFHDTFGAPRLLTPLATHHATPQPMKGRLTPGTKKYCSYWIRHGECDYQQQGCLYKHEMPLDQETLLGLGLRDIPRWYREKHSLGSYLAAGGAGAAFSGQGLKSAAASGIHEDDRYSKTAGNWRAGPRHNYFSSPPVAAPARGNIYNPGASRTTISPSSFSRFLPDKPSGPLFNGNSSSNESSNRRRVPTFQAHTPYHNGHNSGARYINNKGKGRDFTNSNAANVSVPPVGFRAGHGRRRSVSTVLSDIEALVGRNDAERRAKEDAEYKKICDAAEKTKAVETAKAALESKAESSNRRGSGTSARGGKSGWRGGRGKKAGGRTNGTPKSEPAAK